MDRLTNEIGFDGRHQRYGYNLAGELTHLIEAGGSDFGPGKVTHFQRDVLGRLIAKTHEGSDHSADAGYGYDPLGRLTQASNAWSTVAFAYDPVGQLLKETQHLRLVGAATGTSPGTTEAKVYAFAHRYDPLGNRTRTVLPDGQKLNQLFYGSGHLHQINLDGKVVSDFERDALHRETGRTQGQLHSEFAYDPASRLKAQRVSPKAADAPTRSNAFTGVNMAGIASFGQAREVMTGLIERGYGYDAAGQLDRILDNQRGLNVYGYDAINRVTSAQIGIGQDWGAKTQRTDQMQMAANERFHWDAASNRLDDSAANAPSTTSDGGRSFNKVSPIRGNRLTVWQDERYGYYVHGNMVQRIQGKRGSAAQTITILIWDPAHQLQGAEVTRGVDSETTRAVTQSFSYGYDALGRRIHKTDAFGRTTFAWDGDQLHSEERGANRTSYLNESGSFVPLVEIHDGQLHHIHTDHLGTPLEATNEEGRITWKVTYRTWGNVITEEVTEIQQKLRFQGQYFDQETGLHYNRFRYYEPGSGRFVSQDPIGLQGGINLIQYASNPTGWIDPFGLSKSGRWEPVGQGRIRVDPPHVENTGGQIHAHCQCSGRKKEIVVNKDGSQSHASRGSIDDLTKIEKSHLKEKGFGL